ncbi:family 16 glycosylhydrolase [Tamlana agarivorans]|uniref:Family 16 glycosylhydrolase n=1 Tax=Pseudotamlana agarivorans TaxID=481183 RepID=A0ACC5U9R8_9FLAO|nr:family 16 glycosylhydrolase [Tamlana agarivorans]MBU2951016.1 family 16 glycosylhydrolase [Tamlana agarivorans]
MKHLNTFKKVGKIVCVSAILTTTGMLHAQKPTKTENPNDQWQIKWNASDEFNSTSPDWSKWQKTSGLPNTTAWKWDNQRNVENNNGITALTMRQNANNASDGDTYFKSGILKSYATFTYGYFEAKIKGADIGEGVCPSFWLYSNFDRSVSNGQTVYSEIDIVELQQFDWYEGHQDDIRDMDLNLHAVVKQNGQDVWRRPKAYPDAQLNKWRAPWDPTKDFHIYGCEVNEQEIIWYVDGVEVGRKPNTYWHRPMNVTLSLGLRKPFVEFYNNRNNAVNPETNAAARAKLDGMPTTMYVDYVRVWEKSGTSTTPPSTGMGKLQNEGFETGNLNNWDASAGASTVISNNQKSGQHAGSVNNSSIAQLVTLKANTTYTISAFGKVTSGNTAFMGINKHATNAVVKNHEFSSTSYSKGEFTMTTGNQEEIYRIWFWSSGTAYCDDFTLTEGGSDKNDDDNNTTIKVTGVTLSNSNLSLNVGDSKTLSATILPQNASNKNVTWSAGNTAIISINQNGQIQALKDGTTTVQVKTTDGNFSASCNITVNSNNDNDNGSGTSGLPQAGQTISLQSNAGLYLTVNKSSGTAIQATKNDVNALEKFVVVKEDGFYGLQSVSTSKYVTTASDNSLRCGASGIFNRQKFTIESNGSDGVYIKSKINNNYWVLNGNKSISVTASNKSQASVFYWNLSNITNKSNDLSKASSDKNIEIQNEVNIYPNPFTNGNLTIDFGASFSGKFTLYDLNGRIILTENIDTQNVLTINKSNLNQGLYLIKISNKDTSITKKLIVK